MGTEFSCDCGEDRNADHDATYDTEEGLATTLGSEYEAITAPIRIKLISLSESDGYAELCEGCTVEADERETVLEVLEKAALKLGLTMSDAPSLQLQFKKQELAHGLEVQGSGLRDGANGCVLGVDAVRTSKVCIFLAAHKAGLLRKYDAADIRLVCQHAPRRLNEKDKVCLLSSQSLLSSLQSWVTEGAAVARRRMIGLFYIRLLTSTHRK